MTMRHLIKVWVLLVICVLANASSSYADVKFYDPSMTFSLFTPCRGNASFCVTRILATGVIDDAAPANLKRLLADNSQINTVVFDSPGGNIGAAIELGRIIRKHGLNTEVDKRYRQEILSEDRYNTELVTIAENVICYSACAYAFMGGVSRDIKADGLIGVHQFYSVESKTSGAEAQITNAILSQYLIDMGIHRDILDIASFTDSAEMELLTLEIAEKTNLTNQSPTLSHWQLTANDIGDIVLRVEQQKPGTDRYTVIEILNFDGEPNFLMALILHGPFRYQNDANMRNWIHMPNAKPSFCITNTTHCVVMITLLPWSFDSKSVSAQQTPSNIVSVAGVRCCFQLRSFP